MDHDEDAIRLYYDHSSERPLSDVVLEAIARAKEEEITEDTCVLYDDIDPAGLDLLFEESGSNSTDVTFNCIDCEIRLLSGDEIEVQVRRTTDGA